jgi:hypothetical protein
MPPTSKSCVDDMFMEPANHLLNCYTRNLRKQKEGLTDELFLRCGVLRALEGDESGREFLQTLADQPKVQTLARSTWFDAFKSSRRLSLITEVATKSYHHFERVLQDRDWLSAFPELKDFPVWAVDGHQIQHACHAIKDGKGAHVPSGMIFGMCLHHGLVRAMSRYYGDGKRPHEWPIFKQNWRQWLAQDMRKGMPIFVVDPAYIDNLFWLLEKIKKQAMVITREKENMKPTIYGANEFDTKDPVNLGVLADDLAGYSTAALRRIHYRDPKTGKDFVFITTCNHLRPGVIALLYFMRWKIEKIYDVFKNKFKVRKAWGTGETSATMQAHFVALLHNLLTLLLANLEKTGLEQNAVIKRKTKLLDKTPEANRVPTHEMIRHAFPLTCQFVRAARNILRFKIPWNDAYTIFKQRLDYYL